jgi:hypothetical protein
MSTRELMLGQALDHASVVPDDLGQIAKNILQRPGRGLQLMGIVHSASPDTGGE